MIQGKTSSAVLIVCLAAILTGCGDISVSGETKVPGGEGGGAPPSGAVILTWDAPTGRTDLSPLDPATDLSKYILYYGTTSSVYTQAVDIANPLTTSVTYTVSLPTGTYYFAVTAVDQTGLESDYSTEATAAVP